MQIQLNQVSIIGMVFCMVLLGVPIRNITSLIQSGDASMPVSQSQSQSVSVSQPSLQPPSTSGSRENSDGCRESTEGGTVH